MDMRVPTTPGTVSAAEPTQAVLAEVTCLWRDNENAPCQATAVLVHAGRDMLVLEASNPRQALPPVGTLIQVGGDIEHQTGRLAEEGRAGRFLISVGDRPVRRILRLRVSAAGTLRSPSLPEPVTVEIVDLTTEGARIHGVDLPVGSQVTFSFTPPGRDEPVTVRAGVAHTSHAPNRPWIGVVFRLVAMRGGRKAE
ncbi:MAG: hypothetical protein ACR2IK_17225 [Chloroflexota bacterium]